MKGILILLFLIGLTSSCQVNSGKSCCALIIEGLEYDLQCKEINNKYCVTVGRVLRIDAPALISFSKYQKLSSSELDTGYQTIINVNGKSTTKTDTIIQTGLKLDRFFTYSPKSFEHARNIKISMEEDSIKFEYRNTIENVAYENLFKDQVEVALEIISK